MKIDSRHPLAARARPATTKAFVDGPVHVDVRTAQPGELFPLDNSSVLETPALQATLFAPPAAANSVIVRFRGPYPPSSNILYRLGTAGQGSKGRAMIFKTKEHRDYLAAMGNAVRVAQLRDPLLDALPFFGAVKFTYRLFRPRKAGDLDNPLKALFDSLNGVAWRDDSQVVELHGYRFDDKDDPRVELEIEAVPS